MFAFPQDDHPGLLPTMPNRLLPLHCWTAAARCIRHSPGFGIATEIVRCEFANANLGGELLDDVPDQFFRYSFAPNLAGAAYTPEESASLDCSRRRPVIQKGGHPVRNWDGSNVTSLAAEVHNCPMPFALLKMANRQHRQLMPPKPAGEQKCEKRPITFTLHPPAVGGLP